MRIEETLKRAAGLFVDFPEQQKPTIQPNPLSKPVPESAPIQTSRTVEQIVRDAPGPNLDEIKPAATHLDPVIDVDGNVNFGSIYDQAKLPETAITAEQMLELLATLPAELPIESKRAAMKMTVNAMGKASGVTTDSIVADASRKLAALSAYARSFADQTLQTVTKTESEIESLLADIDRRKAMIEEAKSKQTLLVQACTHETDRLDEVLEFFSLDVHPSKYAEPTADS